MYENILIATDGSGLAGQALDHGLTLAKSVGARVLVLNVTQSVSSLNMAGEGAFGDMVSPRAYEESLAMTSTTILDDAAAKAKEIGVVSKTCRVTARSTAKGILDTAEANDCDLIVMSSHGRRGVRRAVLGSQASEVVALSDRPVLVVR